MPAPAVQPVKVWLSLMPTPSALALSADQSRLYVVCSDANAAAVVDVTEARSHVLGFVPTGDRVGLREDRPIENNQDAEPDDLDGELGEEIAAKRHLAEQAELGEGIPKFEVARHGDYPP